MLSHLTEEYEVTIILVRIILNWIASQMATLLDLLPGEQAEVLGLNPEGLGNTYRLIAMGLIPGTLLTLIRKAPLGDPLQIFFRGFSLSIRKKEAQLLTIKRA